MKIVSIVGARPQFIKAAAVSRVLRKVNGLTEILVHTGQHFDINMSDIFFDELDIPKPDYQLGIGGGSHGENTGRMIEQIEKVLTKETPNWVMVYGDTDSTLAGAIAAKKLHISIAHVEAGLRSFNMSMPEEVNRILTDRISNVLFCPTKTSTENLLREGYSNIDAKILLVGDVMFDASLYYKKYAKRPDSLIDTFESNKFCLCTIHRADNTSNYENLSNIFKALEEIAKEFTVLLPLHPRTAKVIHQSGLDIASSNIKIIDPVGYLEMIWLLENCHFVITDSGGLQKEAYFFSKPCITLRNETEWVELLHEGVNWLAGNNFNKIMEVYSQIKTFNIENKNLYGDGNAAQKIANFFSQV
jgi:UDP-GlcNAc3NAcA epimerase